MLSIVKNVFSEDTYTVGVINNIEAVTETKNDGYDCIRESMGYVPLSFFNYIKVSDDYGDALDAILTKNVVFMNDGQNMSAYILTEAGLIDSYVSVYKNEDNFLLEVYCWDIEKVKSVLSEAGCEFTDADMNCVLIEGPESGKTLNELYDVELDYISYQNHEYFDCAGDELLIARTGYTGEFGYKVLGNKQQIENFLGKLASEKPDNFVGIDSVKQCMAEVKQPDFQLSYTKYSTNMFELDYQWFVDFKKDSDYRGKEALYETVAANIQKNTICAVSNASIEDGAEVKADDAVIGQVIDCQFSKKLGKYIVALFIDRTYAQSGFEYTVNGETVCTVSAPYIIPKSWSIGKEDN